MLSFFTLLPLVAPPTSIVAQQDISHDPRFEDALWDPSLFTEGQPVQATVQRYAITMRVAKYIFDDLPKRSRETPDYSPIGEFILGGLMPFTRAVGESEKENRTPKELEKQLLGLKVSIAQIDPAWRKGPCTVQFFLKSYEAGSIFKLESATGCRFGDILLAGMIRRISEINAYKRHGR